MGTLEITSGHMLLALFAHVIKIQTIHSFSRQVLLAMTITVNTHGQIATRMAAVTNNFHAARVYVITQIKELSAPTTDDIEVRLCADQTLCGEDIRVERIEMYIQ